MDGREDIKENEGKGGGSGQGTLGGGGGVFHKALGVFHKALGSACVSLESKAFIAYHTSHKACMEDAGISGNIQTCTHTTIRHQ